MTIKLTRFDKIEKTGYDFKGDKEQELICDIEFEIQIEYTEPRVDHKSQIFSKLRDIKLMIEERYPYYECSIKTNQTIDDGKITCIKTYTIKDLNSTLGFSIQHDLFYILYGEGAEKAIIS